MSLMNMPSAAPKPPTTGPNRIEKTAGMMTAGQNLTTPMTGAKMPRWVKYPKPAYNAPHNPMVTASTVFRLLKNIPT
jgi:hypothetical protein